MQGKIENRVEILIRHRNNDSRLAITLLYSNLEIAFAFVEAHREKLTLLSRNEQPLDIEIVNPVTNVRTQASFVERQIVVKRIQCSRPNPAHVLAGIVFCF